MTTELLIIGFASVLVLVPRTWTRTRHLVTLVHEAGHGGVAIFTRRQIFNALTISALLLGVGLLLPHQLSAPFCPCRPAWSG